VGLQGTLLAVSQVANLLGKVIPIETGDVTILKQSGHEFGPRDEILFVKKFRRRQD
jgi:hypothetical protein